MNKYSSTLPPIQPHDIPIFLTDDIPEASPWDERRKQLATMRDLLAGTPHAERMAQCADWLIYANLANADEYGRKRILYEASFCRCRVCPVCSWRRSLRLRARFHQILKPLIETYPGSRFLFLTLSARNVAISELGAELDALRGAWQRLTQVKRWRRAVLGYVKNIEVTRGAGGTAHPHMHVLVQVRDGYFDKKQNLYIDQKEFITMWKEALQVDYEPSVFVEAIKEHQGSAGITNVMQYAVKVLSYSTKAADLIQDRDWLLSYIEQTDKRRFFSSGGSIKKLYATLDAEPADDELVQLDEQGRPIDAVEEARMENIESLTKYDWSQPYQRFVRTMSKKCYYEPRVFCSCSDCESLRRRTWGELREEKHAADDAASAKRKEEMSWTSRRPGFRVGLRDILKIPVDVDYDPNGWNKFIVKIAASGTDKQAEVNTSHGIYRVKKHFLQLASRFEGIREALDCYRAGRGKRAELKEKAREEREKRYAGD